MGVQLSIEDYAGITRIFTDADGQAFADAEPKLEEIGFRVNEKPGWVTLLRAFNNSPAVPVTAQTIVATVQKYPDSFSLMSADEVEFNKLSKTLGPDGTARVKNLLNGHRLFAPPEPGGLENFVALVRYGLSQGWGLDGAVPGAFQRLVNNYRTTTPNAKLYWKPTPDELRKQKEAEEKAVKDAAWHKEYTDYHDPKRKDPEFLKAEAEKERLAAIESFNEEWKGKVMHYIASIQSNLDRAEAQQKFSQPAPATSGSSGGWQQTWYNLDAWYQRTKVRRAMAGRMG